VPRGLDEGGDQTAILTDIRQCHPALFQIEAGVIQDIGTEERLKIFEGVAHGRAFYQSVAITALRSW
jgi:hypothetical protein